MASLLEQLRAYTTVVSDTGDINASEQFKPQDATTNPSLAVLEGQQHNAMDDARDLLTHPFHRVGVNIDALNRFGCPMKTSFFFQPLRKIVGHQMQTQPRFNEVMVNRMRADLLQAIEKSRQRVGRERRGQHHNVSGAKIEGLVSSLGT